MIAARLSSVWQVAGVAGAALICYLVSQSVAAERAGLAKVDREIQSTRDEIAKLNTEIGTRSRAGQLERWNMDVLALKAPRPAQFVADGVQLVSLYASGPRPALPLNPAIVASQGAVDKVAYQPAPAVAPVVAAPKPAVAEPAPAPRVKPQPRVIMASAEAEPAQPLLRTATYVRPKANRMADDTPLVERTAFHPHAASLLPDDIADIAAAERKGHKTASPKAER